MQDFLGISNKRLHTKGLELYRTYVDSMLKVCNEDYCSHPVITVNTLERLFVITKNQSADLQLTKDAYNAFEARHAHDGIFD